MEGLGLGLKGYARISEYQRIQTGLGSLFLNGLGHSALNLRPSAPKPEPTSEDLQALLTASAASQAWATALWLEETGSPLQQTSCCPGLSTPEAINPRSLYCNPGGPNLHSAPLQLTKNAFLLCEGQAVHCMTLAKNGLHQAMSWNRYSSWRWIFNFSSRL